MSPMARTLTDTQADPVETESRLPGPVRLMMDRIRAEMNFFRIHLLVFILVS